MNRWIKTALLAGAAFAVPAAINAAVARKRKPMLNALPGDTGAYNWALGSISYQERGAGTPLVLVHGVGAGESAYEWRRNFDVLSEHFHVYALDMPGFGNSERRKLTYTADLYVLALIDFLRDVVQHPAYIVASSLSAAYTIRAAVMRPELIEKLALICPTGLEKLTHPIAGLSQLAYGTLSLPAFGEAIYNGIASQRYIESYLRENVYYDAARVTPTIVEQYYQTAHRPGGRYALRSFLSGLLTCDISREYPEMRQPHLIVWGRQATTTPVENAQKFLELNPTARLRIFEHSRFLPHDEEADDFNDAVVTFFGEAEAKQISPPPSTDLLTEAR